MIRNFKILVLWAMAISLMACSTSVAVQMTPTIDATELAAVVYGTQTAMAAAAPTVGAAQPSATPKAATVLPTGTPVPPTATPSPTATSTPTPTTSPTPVLEDCTNKAEFVEETVPDDTRFTADQSFVKSWTLRNVGTCTWTTGYNLVFVDGSQMGAEATIPLSQTVNANETIRLSVKLTAPKNAGEYRGDWKLRSPGGTVFGVGKQADETFWVKISVVESVTGLRLGDPDIVENFDQQGRAWYWGEDDNLRYAWEEGKLVMTARNPIGDQWRVNYQVAVGDAYLQATFKTGENCEGKNSYGMIVRASDENNNGIYNSGYVYTFSCDGMYRLYLMNKGEYTGLIGWTSAVDLLKGPNQANQMGFWIKGNQIKLYVNGRKVAELNDASLAGGRYGLTVRAEGEDNFSVAVEEVLYWELE
ncbi:MAG: NBR1-Ig-like domain-containing protein [Chloroflexota bacterium]